MNVSHKTNKAKSRLRRLRRRLLDIAPDRKDQVVNRINVLAALLGMST